MNMRNDSTGTVHRIVSWIPDDSKVEPVERTVCGLYTTDDWPWISTDKPTTCGRCGTDARPGISPQLANWVLFFFLCTVAAVWWFFFHDDPEPVMNPSDWRVVKELLKVGAWSTICGFLLWVMLRRD